MPPARWGHTATLIAPGRALVFGGFGDYAVMNDLWLLEFGVGGGGASRRRPSCGAVETAAGAAESEGDKLQVDTTTGNQRDPPPPPPPPVRLYVVPAVAPHGLFGGEVNDWFGHAA